MGDWRPRLHGLVRADEPADEDKDEGISYAHPPSGRPWPEGLPPCPELAEFYTICDGGSFPGYHISPLAELVRSTEVVRDWAGDYAEGPPAAGRMVAFADHEFGHHVVWDADRDLVGIFDMDGAGGFVFSEEVGPDLIGLPIATFLERLITGSGTGRGREDDE